MRKTRKPTDPDKSSTTKRDVESYREATGSSETEAAKALKAVAGRLSDAFTLFYCLTGHPPSGLPAEMLEVRSGFALQVSVPKSTKKAKGVDAARLTSWQDVPIAKIEEIVTEERAKGHLRSDESERCAICMCDFEPSDDGQVVHLSKCKEHFFHQSCIQSALIGAALKCPVCGVTYGQMEGTMPSGRMRVDLVPDLQCASFPPGSWLLSYDFRDGVQDDIHYSGNSRQALLPNTEEGREVLRLFICAFYRRHTFKVGTSVTTGVADTVVWAGIHHKSSAEGGATNFGYPDPTYFVRVKEELATRGVFYSD